MINRFAGEFRFLSNFYPSEVEVAGMVFPTVEHAYQAYKTTSRLEREKIMKLETPGQAKRAGQKLKIREDWDDIKVEVMRKLVFRKFSTHIELKSLLLSTGKKKLIEGNSWGDVFWGVCDGQGENWLGRILMETRELLRSEK